MVQRFLLPPGRLYLFRNLALISEVWDLNLSSFMVRNLVEFITFYCLSTFDHILELRLAPKICPMSYLSFPLSASGILNC